MGQAYLNLRKILDEGRDTVKAMVPVKGTNGESLGTLSVTLIALEAPEDDPEGNVGSHERLVGSQTTPVQPYWRRHPLSWNR